ncbi:DUF6691 family protein [uncultured Chitinophaga sp.]|uniref:DUF6691 family protein n=1 Tax=uncultured Chitinophaga sp. TaxID=339340 RepID=UPI0026211A86|nr:DUF6691 family protein [uncultured Chitinophaga sp.]
MSDVQLLLKNTDAEVRSLDANTTTPITSTPLRWQLLRYIAAGILLGIVFVKGEIISWFRIQEMFRLQSFHMYGVIGSAVAVSALAIWLIRRFNISTVDGETITIPTKSFHKGQVIGGLIFGLGWALTGACPGPFFAMIGTGAFAAAIMILSAIAGTWVYGLLREKLPH